MPAIRTLSQARVHPATPSERPQTVLLSILDATHVATGTAATILLYDAAPSTLALHTSLAHTLDLYPQWAGRLHRQPGRPGRVMLTFGAGADTDPGVAYLAAAADNPIRELLPGPGRVRDLSHFPEKDLLPECALSLTDLNASLPNLAIKVTTFTDGGVAIAFRIAHPLADAVCLAGFALDWAATTRSACQYPTPYLGDWPVFDPRCLDTCAAGNPNGDIPDGRLNPLPTHEYDPWISENCPVPGKWTQPPEEFQSLALDPPGRQIPWEDWDPAAPVSQTVVHFPEMALRRLRDEVVGVSDSMLSYHDVLLAHLWNCVARARVTDGQEPDLNEIIYLTYALGIRKRVHPALPERSMGSPTISAAIPGSPSQVCGGGELAHLAKHIRAMVKEFTPGRVAGYLGMKMQQQCPHRYWPAFMGRRHLMATSWVGTRLYEVDFGNGGPGFVKAVFARVDGIMQLMEGRPGGAMRELWGGF
ncbi:hypothetical protein BO71DRAFT_487835 [Aspergillus ellipticus CBS 707.79]|uniref:Transferase family protein n=1 Tax=Aspergillus ellipticus CBS 707.79 TaxID=1448320 RepID=A0A319CWC4_9EURO|nr:hypothetical protein BO71DRAFT_487835 [Aspergillus ellipticus CBS 707.79]